MLLFGMCVGGIVGLFLNHALRFGQAALMFKDAEYMCLQMLALSLEDASFLKTVKHRFIKQMDSPENIIKITINDDEFNLDRWKKESIKRLMARYPSNYSRIVEYNNWTEAMQFLEKERKKLLASD
tara:strand:- start:3707 stop:4084 length:378 start_codon:yes stop_codon:yes gene_type:complete